MLKRLLSVVLSMVIILSSLVSVGIQTALADTNSWVLDSIDNYSVSNIADLELDVVNNVAKLIKGELSLEGSYSSLDESGDVEILGNYAYLADGTAGL